MLDHVSRLVRMNAYSSMIRGFTYGPVTGAWLSISTWFGEISNLISGAHPSKLPPPTRELGGTE